MLAPIERAPHRPSPLPGLPLSDVSPRPVVMADDPCDAAFAGSDPKGPRKYYRARYYDPKIGRFIGEDPIGFQGGDVNFYAYVGNQPVNRLDPLGNSWASAAANFGVGVLGGLAGAAAFAGVAAMGATAAAGAAVVGVGIGAYQITITVQEVAFGFDPYTGRPLSCDERGDRAAAAAGGFFGAGAFGAMAGPRGPLFGRGGQYRDEPGFFNRGNFRWGWSWHGTSKSGQNYFCLHGGKPKTAGHWHGFPKANPVPQTPYPGWLPPWMQNWW